MVPNSFVRLVWGFGEIGDRFGNVKVEEERDVRAVGGSISLVGRLMKCRNSDMFAFRMFVFSTSCSRRVTAHGNVTTKIKGRACVSLL